MAAIGSVWAAGSWADDVWADGSWADRVVSTAPITHAGKYAPEHATALRDLALATGFQTEHASASQDLRDAGV